MKERLDEGSLMLSHVTTGEQIADSAKNIDTLAELPYLEKRHNLCSTLHIWPPRIYNWYLGTNFWSALHIVVVCGMKETPHGPPPHVGMVGENICRSDEWDPWDEGNNYKDFEFAHHLESLHDVYWALHMHTEAVNMATLTELRHASKFFQYGCHCTFCTNQSSIPK